MKNKVTLYIATHNKTGLKYFGKTTRYFTEEDLQKNYHGSGVYWKRHLKKHGDDVTMKIYGIYDIAEVKEIALQFSRENNIVEDYNNWANQTEENGLQGGNMYNRPKGEFSPLYNIPRTEEVREKIRKSNKEKNIKLSLEQRNRISIMNSGEGNGMFGKKHKESSRKKISESRKGKVFEKVICPYCKKEGGGPNMTRYHFNNCKYKGK